MKMKECKNPFASMEASKKPNGEVFNLLNSYSFNLSTHPNGFARGERITRHMTKILLALTLITFQASASPCSSDFFLPPGYHHPQKKDPRTEWAKKVVHGLCAHAAHAVLQVGLFATHHLGHAAMGQLLLAAGVEPAQDSPDDPSPNNLNFSLTIVSRI